MKKFTLILLFLDFLVSALFFHLFISLCNHSHFHFCIALASTKILQSSEILFCYIFYLKQRKIFNCLEFLSNNIYSTFFSISQIFFHLKQQSDPRTLSFINPIGYPVGLEKHALSITK